MRISKNALVKLLFAALIPAAGGAARASAPKTMVVLSSAAYDSGDDIAAAVTTDKGEDVFITGTVNGNDFVTLKYNKTLTLGPAQIYTNGRTGNAAAAIAIDGQGDIIVAGAETNAGAGDQDYITLKYNPAFTALLSSAVYDGGYYDNAAGVGVDSHDNIFVTGYSNDGITDNAYTIKYDASLNQLSTAAYDSGHDEQATAIAVDHNDNVIVVGFTNVSGTNDFFIIKYDNNLNRLYDPVFFDSGGDDRAAAVAVDSNDNIIVTGRQHDSSGSTTYNYCTRKYDSSLNFISSAVYDSGGKDIPTGAAVDSNDNIIVTGYTGPGVASANDYFTIKYDKNFNVISSASYDGGSTDQASAVAVDASDNVIVTGQSYDGVTDNYFSIKYNASPKLTKVSPIYIGETTNVTFNGYGLISGSSVTFADPGISTGAIAVISGQITLSVTPAASVLLGVTTVTVTAANGEEVTDTALAETRLRHIVAASSSAAITAETKLGPVTVDVTAGAFSQQEALTIYTVPAPAGNPSPVGAALYLDVSPADVPQQDIFVTLHYDPAALGGTPESSLSLAYYSSSSVWVPLTSVVDAAGNSVRAPTRFVNTKFAVVKPAQGGGGGGTTPGGLGGAKVYPNPYRPGSGGDFDQSALGDGIVFAGLGAGQAVKLTIFDLAGQLVYQKSGAADSSGRYLWDTKTVSGGKAASGVYIYMIKGGGEPKKGKFSIIR